MLLSIIIPCYNVDKYIRKCLLSCLHQSISSNDYEVIVVNDGSIDGTLSIAQQIARNHKNIRIHDQQNLGLSRARNVGLSLAKGEYVWFVDSDDWIENNCLSDIFIYLDGDLDLLHIQHKLSYENLNYFKNDALIYWDGVISGKKLLLQGGLPAPAQFDIYRRNFLLANNLYFYPNIYHEDTEFKPRVTYLANKCASSKRYVYNYLQRTSGNITSLFKLKNGLDLIIAMNSLVLFCIKYEIPTPYLNKIYSYIGLNMNSLLYGYKMLQNAEQEKLYLALTNNVRLFKCMLSSCKAKYMLEAIPFLINIKLGLKLYKIFR